MPAYLDKKIVEAILEGTYTHAQLREFVELCYALAVPPIRKRISSGRLNLQAIGLSEKDIVQDSIADLFIPNHEHKFPKFAGFFAKIHPSILQASEAELTRTLRQLIVGKVNKEIIRLLTDADPALADILRNVKLGIERTNLFYKMTWFNEKFLVPRDADVLRECPPMPDDMLEQAILQAASKKDTVPQLLRKLHATMIEQGQYRRMVSIVTIAIVFKKVITSEDRGDVETQDDVEWSATTSNLTELIEKAIAAVDVEARRTYVRTGKCSEEECTAHISIVRTIFNNHMHSGGESDETFFEIVQKHLPGTTVEEYKERHKSIVEYLVRLTKARLSGLRNELE